jgi:hypothetical protein
MGKTQTAAVALLRNLFNNILLCTEVMAAKHKIDIIMNK